MAAIRFVVQGKGAYTTVEGERFLMEEGDLILTPNWTWHDHFNGSDKPIVWLDGLDGPLIQSFNALFFEMYEKDVQEVTRREGQSARPLGFARSPKTTGTERQGLPFRYSWNETYESLKTIGETENDPFDGVLLRYVNPMTGGFTLPTMSCEIQVLNGGLKTRLHRHTSTALYHVFRGRGRTKVGEGYLEWKRGDSFVIPLWQWHGHENLSEEEAILFSMNDRPAMEAFELYREEERGRTG
jgi:gentisate 1,2-dioxygenase